MIRKIFCFTCFTCLTFFLFSPLGFTTETIFSFSFDTSDLIFEKVQGYDRIKLVGGRFSAEPGSPLLPMEFIQIAIPTELEVEGVEVVSFASEELPGTYEIYPAQPMYPISSLPTQGTPVEFVGPDPLWYDLSSEYPGKLAKVTSNGFLGGQHITGVALYPLQYVPDKKKLVFYTRIECRLIFKSTSCFPVPVNRRSQSTAGFYSDLVKSVVINPEDVRLETRGLLSPEEEVDYLIITDDSFVSTFQGLADWKILRGISTEVKGISWVLSSYSGYDDPEKIRNCIRDYYTNHGTKWVLLGGDTPILPHRVALVMGDEIPCDLYFSDLDSNWDANGDHVYGEYGDAVDMYPDVFVGRAPANDISQAQTFVSKCLTYETNPPTDYQNKILYAAEMLWAGTDAAELKNYIDSSFVPDHFQATRLYETSGNLDSTTFGDGLNQGQNIINHNGHGNFDVLSIGSDAWYSSDMDNLINAPRYSLFYTFGCITAAIDKNCIAEHFVNNPNGGGFAYCGNTRYGWGRMGAPLEGPGPEFDIEFFRALFYSANYQVGKTLANSKIPFIPIAQEAGGSGPYYRWTMYTLLLLGDPALEVWTDIPAELYVSHAPVFFAGFSYLQVNVAPDSALVSCVKDGDILGTAYSSGGIATVFFDSPLVSTGTMHLTVTKHDYMSYHDSLMVIPPEGPYVIYQSHEIDDSQGNDNGVVNPDETILTSITVKNIGVEDAQNVSATLREEDDYITVIDSVKSFGDLDSGMTAESMGEYVFEVSPSCPDSHLVMFSLEAANGETSWVTDFFLLVVKPDFVLNLSSDSLFVHPGDSGLVKLFLTSVGGFNWQVNLTHSELPSNVSGSLEPIQLVPTDSSIFRIYVMPDATPGVHSINFTATGGEILREKEMVLGILAPYYYGPVWHISPAGYDLIGNGSEEYPFRTIQKGINIANHGDTVLVQTGEYVENIDFSGKAILAASYFIFDSLESTIEATVINGNGSGSVVTFQSGEDSNSVIRGFTLTGGYASYGGGIRCYGSSPTIVENFMVDNECVYNRGGPAIYCGYGSNPRILKNLITDCTGPAAIFLHVECDAQVINNTVCNNSWGGMSIQGNSDPYVKNNIFYNNNYYGIHASGGSWEILYNDVYGSDNNYLEIADQTGINGNISTDPLFFDVDIGDYHLAPGSPCIDAGDPADSVPPGGGIRIDMGAFEFIYGPYVFYHSHQIDDSGWNNNGVVNPGEVVAMSITAINNGTEAVYNVSGILREDDDFVVVTDSVKEYGDLEPQMTAESMGNYWFEVDSSCSTFHPVTFTLELSDGSSVWRSTFVEMVIDTDFAITFERSPVRVSPGDSLFLEVMVNTIGGFASSVNLSHSELPTGVSGVFDPDNLIPPDSSIFKISTIPDAPTRIHNVTITATGGGIIHQEELELAILNRGDANVDGVVEVGDVVYLLNYLYKGGLPPYVWEAGDVNADSGINIGDVVYLICYLFRDCPPPPPGKGYEPQNYPQKTTVRPTSVKLKD